MRLGLLGVNTTFAERAKSPVGVAVRLRHRLAQARSYNSI
jgi:hypothetical protein